MDNTQNVISFCTGYSGLEIGIRRAGVDVRTICYLEIEVYVQAVLVKAMEEGRLCSAPIWTNVKSFDARPFRGIVDGITGGFPCQPFSSAGKRKGQEDPRHLWPSIANSIRLCRPGWVFLENVPGLVTLGLRDVLQDLGRMGYRTTWGIFSAEEVGAPHQRKRVFILGYSASLRPHRGSENCEGEQSEVLGERLESDGELAHPASREPRQSQARNGGQDIGGGSEEELADTRNKGSSSAGGESQHKGAIKQSFHNFSEGTRWPARPGEEQYEWEEPRVVANSKCERLEGQRNNKTEQHWENEGVQSRPKNGGDKHTRKTQSELGRESHARQGHDRVDPIANRVDRLRLLGNGVVPQTAELAWRTLWKQLNDKYDD